MNLDKNAIFKFVHGLHVEGKRRKMYFTSVYLPYNFQTQTNVLDLDTALPLFLYFLSLLVAAKPHTLIHHSTIEELLDAMFSLGSFHKTQQSKCFLCGPIPGYIREEN
jgi:hypothetical protein